MPLFQRTGVIPVTLGLAFGGGTTGITYANQTAHYMIIDRRVIAPFYIELSSKGSSTGVISITGLPIAASASSASYGHKSTISMNNCSGVVPMFASIDPSATVALIQYQGATGIGSLSDTHCTNTTVVAGTLDYVF